MNVHFVVRSLGRRRERCRGGWGIVIEDFSTSRAKHIMPRQNTCEDDLFHGFSVVASMNGSQTMTREVHSGTAYLQNTSRLSRFSHG